MAETDLRRLLSGMAPELGDEPYVFATLPPGAAMPALSTLRMLFREAEGTTLIVTAAEAEAAGIAATFACRIITLSIQSSLEAVGFMAAVTTALAERGIGANPVAAFHHDHLFVPEAAAEDAMAALLALQTAASR
jgi:uncharacterized protein